MQMSTVAYRAGRASDVPVIRGTLLKLMLNPLHVEPSNFVVAHEEGAEKEVIVGFGQVRSIRGNNFELARSGILLCAQPTA